jgi:hypothetical protein
MVERVSEATLKAATVLAQCCSLASVCSVEGMHDLDLVVSDIFTTSLLITYLRSTDQSVAEPQTDRV